MTNAPETTSDPVLGILRELQVEFERELAPARVSRERRVWRERRAARVVRRSLLLVALLSLVGASALAGRSVLRPGSQRASSTPALLLAHGRRHGEAFRLEAYAYRGAGCYALFVEDAVTSACRPVVGERTVYVDSALAANRRFIAGIAGRAVASVLIHVGTRTLSAPTHPIPVRGRESGQPGLQARWFLQSVPREPAGAGEPPASILARSSSGRGLGAPVLDCSLSAASNACHGQLAPLAAEGAADAVGD